VKAPVASSSDLFPHHTCPLIQLINNSKTARNAFAFSSLGSYFLALWRAVLVLKQRISSWTWKGWKMEAEGDASGSGVIEFGMVGSTVSRRRLSPSTQALSDTKVSSTWFVLPVVRSIDIRSVYLGDIRTTHCNMSLLQTRVSDQRFSSFSSSKTDTGLWLRSCADGELLKLKEDVKWKSKPRWNTPQSSLILSIKSWFPLWDIYSNKTTNMACNIISYCKWALDFILYYGNSQQESCQAPTCQASLFQIMRTSQYL